MRRGGVMGSPVHPCPRRSRSADVTETLALRQPSARSWGLSWPVRSSAGSQEGLLAQSSVVSSGTGRRLSEPAIHRHATRYRPGSLEEVSLFRADCSPNSAIRDDAKASERIVRQDHRVRLSETASRPSASIASHPSWVSQLRTGGGLVVCLLECVDAQEPLQRW